MERSVPGIAALTRKIFGAVKNQITTMPDFIVQDERNSRLHLVEVKYRASGTSPSSRVFASGPCVIGHLTQGALRESLHE